VAVCVWQPDTTLESATDGVAPALNEPAAHGAHALSCVAVAAAA
jgi:hypothetical protein